jgi:hypothetical protein
MVAAALCLVDACRAPTQVTLDLATGAKMTCGALLGVRLIVTDDPASSDDRANGELVTATATCAEANGREIGTLVVTPGASGKAAVVIVAGIRNDARSCNEGNKYVGCVVARRTFASRDHVSATVPILIDPDCVDIPSDVATTCKKGTCVTSEVDCGEDGSCLSPDPRGRDDDAGPLTVDGAADAAGKEDGTANDGASGDGAGVDASDSGFTTGSCCYSKTSFRTYRGASCMPGDDVLCSKNGDCASNNCMPFIAGTGVGLEKCQ